MNVIDIATVESVQLKDHSVCMLPLKMIFLSLQMNPKPARSPELASQSTCYHGNNIPGTFLTHRT